MRVLRRWLMTIPLILAAVYLLVVVAFAVVQDRLVFAAAGLGDRGLPQGIAGLETGSVQRPDGGRSRIVTVSVAAPKAIAVFFTGNREDLYAAANIAQDLSRYGITVISSEHPGYGSSDGPASVANFMAEAEAVGAYARKVADAQGLPLLVIGNSIGTFCAVHAASLGLADRLLLRAPPTTMVAAGSARFGFLPVGLLLRHRFDSLSKASLVRCPAMVLHGDRDRIVPQRLGKQLAAAFAGPTEFVECPGYGHNDLPISPDGPFAERIRAFLLAR